MFYSDLKINFYLDIFQNKLPKNKNFIICENYQVILFLVIDDSHVLFFLY